MSAAEVPGAVDAIVADLSWLGIEWEEGPSPQSERAERHREAAAAVGTERRRRDPAPRRPDAPARRRHPDLPPRQRRRRRRLRDHARRPRRRPPAERGAPAASSAARSAPSRPSSSTTGSSSAPTARSSRSAERGLDSGRPAGGGHPGAGRARLPRRARRAARTTSTSTCRGSAGSRSTRSRRCPTRSWRARLGAPVELAPALRGARDLNEAREIARSILEPEPAALPRRPRADAGALRRAARRNGGLEAGAALVRELKAVGGDLRALRLALTGAERGPELWTVIAALPREEALRRVDAAL